MARVQKRVLASLSAAALFVLSGAGGCSGHEVDEERVGKRAEALDGGGDTAMEGGACRSVALVASKSSGPSQWADASETLAPELSFSLPSFVPVTSGNAGNHWITFTFARGSSAAVSCRYNGGASQAHPNSAAQIALGLRYVFLSCSNGATAGSTVIADHVTLHVDNGDSPRLRPPSG